nr:cytochrome P450 CYP307B1 [Dendroctonus rhizophagus]
MPLTLLTASLLLLLVLIVVGIVRKRPPGTAREPPMPLRLPIIGHLHLLRGYSVPYQAFTALKLRYGPVVKLQLGAVKCVVVNGQRHIREALVTRGHHFDFRPNFERYQRLFAGNKENSLAFCDWSSTQKARRDMLKAHTFPRAFTTQFQRLEGLVVEETGRLVRALSAHSTLQLKPLLLQTCANVFLSHFCSVRFGAQNAAFLNLLTNFDEVFFEVNQGYAADFLPFLMPLHRRKLQRLSVVTHKIREFINREVIGDRLEAHQPDMEPADYLDSLIGRAKAPGKEPLDWDTALFALEDIIGGHSAVGNFLTKLFAFLVTEPEVQRRIQEEIDSQVGVDQPVTISHRLVYTQAVIYEAIRLISSPIVPRVANQTSELGGYTIEKGTVLFLNNHDLSMSEELWTDPQQFRPERFIRAGKLFKPEYFLPFGGGRRSCMGYKLVQLVSLGVVGAVMQRFTLRPVGGDLAHYRVPIGSLALPKDSFTFQLEKR